MSIAPDRSFEQLDTGGVASARGRAIAPALPELLSETLAALEAARFRYCLLRGPVVDTVRVCRREVDILVDARDLERFGRIVSEIGFVPLPSWGYGGHHFYVAYEEERGEWVKLDVVTSLGFGGRSGALSSEALAGCLERCRLSSGISEPDVGDALLGLILHCVLDKGAFREDHRRELERLRGLIEANDAMKATAGKLFHAAFSGALPWSEAAAAIRDGGWESLLERRSRIAWELFRQKPLESILRWLGGKVARLMRPLLVASRRRGFSVALVGPDGAGKTGLARALAEDPQIRARIISMGSEASASTSALPWRRWMVEQGNRSLASMIWRLRGRFILFDGHPYGDPISGTAGGSGAELRRKLLQLACVSPDMVLLLDAPPELLHLRKSEHCMQRPNGQRQRYRALVTVDTSTNQERMVRHATSLIWGNYHRHVVKTSCGA